MSAPDFKPQLTEHLRDLHLPAVRRCFEEKARQAERETIGYERYLFELIERECQERREHRIARLLQESKLPLEKTFDNFNLQRLPQKAARQVKSLQDGSFLKRKENVLAFGNCDPATFCTSLLRS
jgi:DNA replication protein DnaC